MDRRSCFAAASALALTMVVLLLAPTGASAQQQSSLQQECRAAFQASGGASGVASRVPACNQSSFNFQKCCDQAKAALSTGPPGCLCDQAVWAEVEGAVASAGVAGLNANTLRQFAKSCGIKAYGAGNC